METEQENIESDFNDGNEVEDMNREEMKEKTGDRA